MTRHDRCGEERINNLKEDALEAKASAGKRKEKIEFSTAGS